MQTMKKILIVEDDVNIQDVFRIIFRSYGYQVECIGNGKELLDRKTNWPDVIILDVQFTGLSGTDVCRHLKACEETRHIPVIMISASTGLETLARNSGADDFIEKPFNMHIILNKVFNLLQKNTIHV